MMKVKDGQGDATRPHDDGRARTATMVAVTPARAIISRSCSAPGRGTRLLEVWSEPHVTGSKDAAAAAEQLFSEPSESVRVSPSKGLSHLFILVLLILRTPACGAR